MKDGRTGSPHAWGSHDRGARSRPDRAPRRRAHRLPRTAPPPARLHPRSRAIRALDRLQALSDELAAFRVARKSTLKRLLSPPDVPRGVYLCGGVGRGKSFLMDSFYAMVPLRRKTRVHFHAFMRDVHEELKTLKKRGRSARRRGAAHRAPLPARLLRRVPRLRHRRRDDPRAPADRAVRRRRGVRHDVELSAGRPVSQRAEAREFPADDRAAAASGSTWSKSTAASTTGCARSSRSRRSTCRAGPTGRRGDAADLRGHAHGRRGIAAAHDRGPARWPRSDARAARSGSISRRCATARARSATTSSSRGASPSCSCPTSR